VRKPFSMNLSGRTSPKLGRLLPTEGDLPLRVGVPGSRVFSGGELSEEFCQESRNPFQKAKYVRWLILGLAPSPPFSGEWVPRDFCGDPRRLGSWGRVFLGRREVWRIPLKILLGRIQLDFLQFPLALNSILFDSQEGALAFSFLFLFLEKFPGSVTVDLSILLPQFCREV